MNSLPRVAVVGRQNVGKSTLFNRLVGRRIAIVDSTPGVTRDRIYATVEWNRRAFDLVDTAGILAGVLEKFEEEIQLQIEVAIQQSDLLLFVVDASQGPTAQDEDLTRELRRTGKPVVLVVNKIDVGGRYPLSDFYRWGFEKIIEVSALRGTRSGDLLDLVVENLPDRAGTEAALPEDALRVAVIGKPNVGKSSLVNRILGEERMVVSEVAGTTRDPVDTIIRCHNRQLVLIDTAGLRKKMKTARGLDYYTLLRTIYSIGRCDVAVLLLDAREGANRQDLRIADMVIANGKSVILAVNKWDLIPEKESNSAANLEKTLKADCPHLAYVPVIFISALTGQRVSRILQLVIEVYDQRVRRVPAESLNEALKAAVEYYHPPAAAGKFITITGGRQSGSGPPVFDVLANYPEKIIESYRRYLLNRLRETFPFPGTPIRLNFIATRVRKGRSRSQETRQK